MLRRSAGVHQCLRNGVVQSLNLDDLAAMKRSTRAKKRNYCIFSCRLGSKIGENPVHYVHLDKFCGWSIFVGFLLILQQSTDIFILLRSIEHGQFIVVITAKANQTDCSTSHHAYDIFSHQTTQTIILEIQRWSFQNCNRYIFALRFKIVRTFNIPRWIHAWTEAHNAPVSGIVRSTNAWPIVSSNSSSSFLWS